MDEAEAWAIENEIRKEAKRVALALADHPAFARDIRSVLAREIGVRSRQELDDFYGIGSADDLQTDPDSTEFRRVRRLGELELALNEIARD